MEGTGRNTFLKGKPWETGGLATPKINNRRSSSCRLHKKKKELGSRRGAGIRRGICKWAKRLREGILRENCQLPRGKGRPIGWKNVGGDCERGRGKTQVHGRWPCRAAPDS